jgi:hypothetical protein
VPLGPEQWLILITCRDEKHQRELPERFLAEGLPCRALLPCWGRDGWLCS